MRVTETQAVILAAGIGSRLGDVANGRPKCLLEVGGRSLLRHHLLGLQGIGVERVLVVAGHGAEAVIEEVGGLGEVLVNERYAETNSLHSLWMAREWITGPVMIINGDVLAAPQIYRALREAKGNALAFDSASGTDEEEMKVHFGRGRLQTISKKLSAELSDGESLGILRFDAAGAATLLEAGDQIIGKGSLKEWVPAAIDAVAERLVIRGIDVKGVPWTEIDFPEDLDHAQRNVWPSIEGQSARGDGDSLSEMPMVEGSFNPGFSA